MQHKNSGGQRGDQTLDDFRKVLDVNLASAFIVGQAVPARRLGRAEDIADAVIFLASDAAACINGHELVVDGGASRALLALLRREAPAQ